MLAPDTEKIQPSREASEYSDSPADADAHAERRAVRRLDCTLIPVVTMFYLLSFLDRANIGNARVAGLQKDLHLTDYQYQICVTVLYVPYIAAELPANLLLRRVGPRTMLPVLLTLWGVIATLQGLVGSYAGLAAVRALLGLVEGPMFPGIVLYLSGFYTREELSLRVALFFSAASLSGAFSGLLAAAIQNMDGIGGKAGWAWIFILEGLFSVCMGLAGFFLVPSTPQDSKFLTKAQKDIITRRLEKDRPALAAPAHSALKEVRRALCSPHVLLVFALFFMLGTTLYGLALFLPSIVHQLGFGATRTQLLSVGPFAAAFFVTLGAAYLSDRYNSRAVPAAALSALAVVGYAVYLTAESRHAAYASLFLTVPGVYAAAPVLSAWMANNSEPHYRRATAIAAGFVATNAGGILSTWSFPTREGPKFRRTTVMNLVFSALIVVGSLANALLLARMNARKAHRRAELLADAGAGEGDEKERGERAWAELGDRHPDFRYTL